MSIERVKTFVEGLDDLLGGGIPKGHLVLVSGLPGTMKSSLSYSILHRNAVEGGEPGLYVSLEQTKGSLEQQMGGMGFVSADPKHRVSIIDVATIRKDVGKGRATVWTDFLRRSLETRMRVSPFDLLTIDSLEALEVIGKFEDPRSDLFELFEWLRSLGSTTLILAEAPPEAALFPMEASHHQDASYLADGVIHLKMHQVSDVAIQRRIRIVKMRGTAHETGYFALVFDDGSFSVTRALSV
ncbi:MAG TPA: ATPase domain-containing protein [Thermoplasmata archaeon]|nr:ATPase domain-containing protein [Thermoplasmata archaeon]